MYKRTSRHTVSDNILWSAKQRYRPDFENNCLWWREPGKGRRMGQPAGHYVEGDHDWLVKIMGHQVWVSAVLKRWREETEQHPQPPPLPAPPPTLNPDPTTYPWY